MEVAVKGRAKRRHLNADELQESETGLEALINPQNFSRSESSTSGLNPRTTKRRNCASVTSGAENCFPTCANGLNDEPEDEISLGEDWLPTDLEEEPEINTMDYLEGITADMFEDEFDCADKLVHEEPEAEALPDAAYGLLGSTNDLLQPQGCIDDLPEEVLRQVLSLVPARDLYRSAKLVCHRWRDIIEDATFMPFKKRYYRYLMHEEVTVAEVTSSLIESGVMKPSMSQHSIRNLVISMARHKFGERVDPTKALEHVKKHRFFPQAEASIRLRIRNVPKCQNLNIEGPNPFAVMAVILLLSESVDDVQALVMLLNGCMSYGAITEFLSHMATTLLAAVRNKVKISERLHYNIYYVLHLRENGPFSVSSSNDRASRMNMTSEQLHILSHDIQQDHVVKIVAFAGTGKTTTLIKYAEQKPHLRFLYVAFNKSVAYEASQRFPPNVDCKTVHSLAYKDVGKMYQKKLTSNLTPFSINTVLPKGRGGYAKAKVVATTLKSFMASVDETIGVSHVPSVQVSLQGLKKYITEEEKQLFVEDARNIWNKMKDLNETKGYSMTHDGYLKLWQLQTPKVCLSDQYDVILIDEAQDSTPPVMDVLLMQRCGKMLVGDPHQQIYSFRGAVNALQTVEHTHIYYLTQSFRFGAEIAYVGASILTVCKKVQKILIGGRQKGGVFDEKSAQAREDVANGKSPSQGNTAILFRCNLGVFSEAVRLIEANAKCSIHFIGGEDNIGLNKIKDIWYLMEDKENRKLIRDHLIASFAKLEGNSFEVLKLYAHKTEDRDLEAKLTIVAKYTSRIPDLVKSLRRHSEVNVKKADFILGTVHKAKGLEFEIVMVSDDFVTVPCSRHNHHHFNDFAFCKIPSDEWNLLYVAVTRAKTTLIITRSIRRIITQTGEYFLKSVMPSAPLKAGETPPCLVSACPNCITPGVAFMMWRRQMTYTTGLSHEGALCERCVWTRVGPIAYLMTDDVLSMAEVPERVDQHLFHVIFHAPL
ncbi:F-box DNA helicase 1 [Hippocampus zosterae]|uniref:F-box DNA helicase 1 n=1 Tax=Hippocampus zosterae TaxID=109293 RepID=UPI00223CF63E|nr:F-box DNA helicase 1 [Hippocampus zosterae]